ncbi:MAG: efflux RND transporter periplasmic adaptor subunit [Tepidisphaeraceae bacterium]
MRRSKPFRSIFLAAIVAPVAALAFLAAGCDQSGAATQPTGQGAGRGQAEASRDPVPVQLAQVAYVQLPQLVDAVGTLYGDEESTVAAKVGGRVVEIHADLGDRLPDGAVLAQIDTTDFQLAIDTKAMALREALAKIGLTELPADNFDPAGIATVQRANVQAQNAKARLDRSTQLFKQNPPLISPQEYADIETQYAVAQRDYDVAVLEAQTSLATARSRAAELASAKQALADATVRAPGKVVGDASAPRWAVAQRSVALGELVQPGSAMYRLVADDVVKLRANVPERFVSQLKQGQDASVRIEGNAHPFAGKVTRVSPVVDVQSRTFGIEVTLPNADHQLPPGGFARVAVTVGQRENVPAVPASALYSFAGASRVFAVVEGKAKAFPVRRILERRDNDQTLLIDADLGTTRQIIISNVNKLADGVPVNIEAATQPSTRRAR